jgi:hypothetical protein
MMEPPLVVVEDNHSAAALALQAGPEAYSQTQSQTWYSLALEASVAAPSPSWSDSFPTVAVRRRYWRKRHRAGRKKRRPGSHGRAVEYIRGLAGPDIVPCRVSSDRGGEHSTRTASGPPPGRWCPLRTGVVGGLAARVLQEQRERFWCAMKSAVQGAVAAGSRGVRAALGVVRLGRVQRVVVGESGRGRGRAMQMRVRQLCVFGAEPISVCCRPASGYTLRWG